MLHKYIVTVQWSSEMNTEPFSKTNRRNFLKTTAVSTAAISASAVNQFGHTAGDDTIKIGMIGAGGRCTGAAMDAMRADDGVRLVAMSDVFQEHLDSSCQQIKEKMPDQFEVDDDHIFAGIDGFQKVIDSDVDVVLIACASLFHPKYSRAALEAGKHVFVEKPHAIDPTGIAEVRETIKLAKKKKLSLVSGLMNRYVPGVQETMKRIHDGAIGEIVAIEENFLRAPYVLRERRPDDSEMQFQFRNWYHFSWLSGDDVTQSLVHNLDKALWALGEKTPAKAHGLAGRSSMFGELYGDVFDHHSVVYDYDNGVKIYALCRTQNNCHGGVSDIIMGTKGKCDLLRNKITGETNWQYDGPHGSGYVNEHIDLFKGIRNGKPVVSEYMADSTMTAIMGQLACYSGKQLTWEQACNSKFRFGPADGDLDMIPPKVPSMYGSYPIAIPGRTKVI
jgi:myo-inositol 2-dehydrogenase/D-chiro-inositol 1-dehydrogenase